MFQLLAPYSLAIYWEIIDTNLPNKTNFILELVKDVNITSRRISPFINV